MENLIEATEKKAFKQAAAGHPRGGRTAAAKSAAAALAKGLHQTRPDPLGRRVEPTVDPEMAKKAEAQVSREAKKKAAAAAANGANEGALLRFVLASLILLIFCLQTTSWPTWWMRRRVNSAGVHRRP